MLTVSGTQSQRGASSALLYHYCCLYSNPVLKSISTGITIHESCRPYTPLDNDRPIVHNGRIL